MPQAVVLDILEEEWMIAKLAQLHHSVHDSTSTGSTTDEKAFLERTVQNALQLRHVAFDDVLGLQRHFTVFSTPLALTFSGN